jgi:anti-sigma regulatory factor (Ser/Thr protein kinase)
MFPRLALGVHAMRAEDDQGGFPSLETWASTLPALAADVVTDADLNMPYLYLVVTASPSRLAAVRSQLSHWADELGVRTEEREDIVMAVEEAVSNAVMHAFHAAPGAVMLFAARDNLARAVHVIISDGGAWSTPSNDSGLHGRGLRMMDKLADVFDVHHDDAGTTVVLRWSLPTNA